MGYSIGFSDGRDIGYGVIATCEQPGCTAKIDRGMSYCCGEMRNDDACGLYFCVSHLHEGENTQLCDRCLHNEQMSDDDWRNYKPSYNKKPDHPDWVYWKLYHPSWDKWRLDNPYEVLAMTKRLTDIKYKPSAELVDSFKEE